jgi:hypothetical protein
MSRAAFRRPFAANLDGREDAVQLLRRLPASAFEEMTVAVEHHARARVAVPSCD